MTDNRNDDMDFREVTDDVTVDITDDTDKSTSRSDKEGAEKGDHSADKGQANNTEKPEYEDVCFVCRRPESKAGKMFHMPNNICICDDCMHKTMDAVSQFDYQNLLNNPGLMNELNKHTKGFPGFGFFNMDDLNNGANLGGGIPNSQKIK